MLHLRGLRRSKQLCDPIKSYKREEIRNYFEKVDNRNQQQMNLTYHLPNYFPFPQESVNIPPNAIFGTSSSDIPEQ